MYNLSDFLLYEELLSYFDLEGYELLAKLNTEIPKVTEEYRNLNLYQEKEVSDNASDLNEYLPRIKIMYNILKSLWLSRN